MRPLPRHALSALLLLVTACETPKEVRDLAVETGGAALKLSDELQRNAKAGKAIQDARVDSVDLILRNTTEVRLEVEVRLATAKTVSHKSAAEFGKLREFATAEQALIEKADKTRKDNVDAVRQSLETISLPVEHLRKLSGDMVALGRKEDTWTRLRFTGEFVKDVADRVREAREAAEKKAKDDGETAGTATP